MTRNSKATKPIRMLGVFGCLAVFSIALTGCSSTDNSKSNTSASSKVSSSKVPSSSKKRSVSQSTKPESWESRTAKEFAKALGPDNDLRFKIKRQGDTLIIYNIKAFRTFEWMSSYYIEIFQAVQEVKPSGISKLTVKSEYETFTIPISTVNELKLSDKQILKAERAVNPSVDDDDTLDDNYFDDIIKPKLTSYKEND